MNVISFSCGFASFKKSKIVLYKICERFEPRVHFVSRLSMIVRINVVLNRTVADSNRRFDNLCGSHLQCIVKVSCITSVENMNIQT